MVRPHSERFRAIARLLSDGAWHDREEIMRVVMPCIPYEAARRERAAGKHRQRMRKRYVREQADPDPRRWFEIGARQIVNEQLQSMVETDWVERDGNEFRSLAFRLSARNWRPVEEGLDIDEQAALAEVTQKLGGLP